MRQAKLRVKAYIDGGARGNPGPAAAAVVLLDAADGAVLVEKASFLGRATNNVAEYRALLAAMRHAAELGASEVQVLSDSELLVRQMNGQYRVKNEGLRPLFEQAVMMRSRFEAFSIRHIRREENKQADGLVNRALNLQQDVDGADL